MKNKLTCLVVLALLTAVAGCQMPHMSRIKNEPFVIDNTYKKVPPTHDPKPGSIWKGAVASNTLFGDARARSIGDIITVKITEISQASESATTGGKRASQTTTGIPHLLGLETNYPSSIVDPSKMIDAKTTNDFSGSGSTTRTGSVTATITARVVDVLPSGNLAIEGKREINVNDERKEILLQGIVRPRDIAFDNSVYSTQIADAKLILTGIGVVGEKQTPAFLARLVDIFWPF